MKFNTEFLGFEQQAASLVQAGMSGNPQEMVEKLAMVSYHRLSSYWKPFQLADGRFRENTEFENVWRRYVFDRQLRVLVIDALERIEVTLRTQLAYHHAQIHGPFAYALDRASRPKMPRKEFPDFYFGLLEELARSKEPFIKEFYDSYGDEHDIPPIWEATEVMSFGCIVRLYRYTTNNVKRPIASIFGVPDDVAESWLLTLNTVRNICAHHARLWNRELGTKPIIPSAKEHPDWHNPVEVSNSRVFAVLTICQHSLRQIAPQSRWAHRLKRLIDEYRDIPLLSMGFPQNWQDCPIWSVAFRA